MQFENIIYSQENGIAKIVLNRPDALNAFVAELRQDLVKALDHVREDDSVRAVVITGAGRGFSAGGDVKSMGTNAHIFAGRQRALGGGRSIVVALSELEKPVIAMVNGLAVGAGCSLALACDIIIASEEAKFSEIFVRVGLMPDLGSIFLLPRAVGLHKAKEMIFTGDMVDAREAERIGLVNKVVPAAELESVTMELAQRLAASPTRAIGLAKLLLQRALTSTLADAIDWDSLGQAVLQQTDDHKEGVAAFKEKRKAQFKGQ